MKSYFTLRELCRSTCADSRGIENHPSPEEKIAISNLINKCLNPIREAYGKPIYVNSGYRNPYLNTIVGGQPNSQHVRGEAADIRGENDKETRQIFEVAKTIGNYDQLLLEHGKNGALWVHISYTTKRPLRKVCIDEYKA